MWVNVLNTCVPPHLLAGAATRGCFRFLRLFLPAWNAGAPVQGLLYFLGMVFIAMFAVDLIDGSKQYALIFGLQSVAVALVETMPEIFWNLSLKLFPNVPSVLGSGLEGQEPSPAQLGFWSRWPWRCSREDSEVGFENKQDRRAVLCACLRDGCYLLWNLNFPGSLMPDIVSR